MKVLDKCMEPTIEYLGKTLSIEEVNEGMRNGEICPELGVHLAGNLILCDINGNDCSLKPGEDYARCGIYDGSH